MGRHAKGAPRLRVSMSTVVLGTLIVIVVAVGSLLSSRVQSSPVTAQGVDGTAVVVSSPSCDVGSGGTVVDVVDPAGFAVGTNIRASLATCGYQEGEQLAVQFPAGDPSQLTLAGSDAVDDAIGGGRLLPYGIAVALLLAVAAAAAMWVDSRRRGRAGVSESVAAHQLSDSDDSTAGWPWSPVAAVPQHPTGRHFRPEIDGPDSDRPDSDAPENNGPAVAPDQVLSTSSFSTASFSTAPSGAASFGAASAGRSLSTVDLIFPSTAGLAASLHDELFTHRSS